MKSPKVKRSPLLKNNKTIDRYPIVAIGASSGGLEAVTEILTNLPARTGMAFIIVQHLSPTHKSMLTDFLAKATKMKVKEINDMDKIRPNNVFVIPSDKGIEVVDGHIKLKPRSDSKSATSIDVLFSSLAQSQKGRVIGIILSGSASDGTLGLKEIKGQGGITFAQDNSARFPSMPQSAIASGAVDFVMSPKEIAEELARISKHPFIKAESAKLPKGDLIESGNPDLVSILNQLQRATGVQFSSYKMSTIKRRITRRVLLYKLKTLKEYAKLLENNSEEVDILFQDLLINVTSFFRDSDAHAYLKAHLLPELIDSKKKDDGLRIWVPACSTGEEVYSIAMMVAEILEEKQSQVTVQIFATDLSSRSVDKARAGIYSDQEVESVGKDRIQRFFSKTGTGFKISKSIRSMCTFAVHNILTDPPFSHLDFISCCNLFIYLDTPAQKKVLMTFHYAMNAPGYLMLGKSETVSAAPHLFSDYNKVNKIYSRKKNSGPGSMPTMSPGTTFSSTGSHSAQKERELRSTASVPRTLDKVVDELLISEYMPPCVVVGQDLEIVQFRGDTDFYLKHSTGKATLNILKMTRPEISIKLRTSLSKAIKSKTPVNSSGIEVKGKEGTFAVSIEILRLENWEEPMLVVLFSRHKLKDDLDRPKAGKTKTTAKDLQIQKLEKELETAHADALAMEREQEAFAVELQCANEEIISSNEEFQTVNEELETSKEEIESANEELITTNQELQTRNDLLNESYEYSNAIISTIQNPLLVLDDHFLIKSANPAFYKTFGLSEKRTEGILLFDIVNKDLIPQLRALFRNILKKGSEINDFEIIQNFPGVGEKVLLLNANKVIQKKHGETLILLSFQDVTEIRKKTKDLQDKEAEQHKKETKASSLEKDRLKEAVEVRTQELNEANKLLETKNHDFQQVNKELESFTYVSSHDLQEPLRKIQTLTERILEKDRDNLSDQGKTYFNSLKGAAERMQNLIKDLLEFSRLNVGERKFVLIDLRVVIEGVINDMKETIEAKKGIVEVKEVCNAFIIPFQFTQLMSNLLSNALKFSKDDVPPHIVIEGKRTQLGDKLPEDLNASHQYCHLCITDNGIGLEARHTKRIFEVFQQVHDKVKYPGTGIGLAIVKKVVENHHGAITVSSEVGKGTRFNVYLPLSRNDVSYSGS